MGALVAEAMEKAGGEGAITVEESRSKETTLEVVEGMQFDHGYLSPYFVSDPEKMEVVLESPFILLTDQKVTRLGECLFEDFPKPTSQLGTRFAGAQDPCIVVIPVPGVAKCKGSIISLCDAAQITLRLIGVRILSADELGPPSKPFEPEQSGITIRARIHPLPNSVVVTVTHKGSPQPRGLLVMESQIIAGDRAARKPGQHHSRGIGAKVFAEMPDRCAAVRECRLRVVRGRRAPPVRRVVRAVAIKIGEADPDAALSTRQAKSEFCVLGGSQARVARLALVAVSRPFNNQRKAAFGSPVRGKVERVVDGSLLPTGSRFSNAFSRSGRGGRHFGNGEVGRYA